MKYIHLLIIAVAAASLVPNQSSAEQTLDSLWPSRFKQAGSQNYGDALLANVGLHIRLPGTKDVFDYTKRLISCALEAARANATSTGESSDEGALTIPKIAHMLVRLDQVAGFIVNANHSIMRAAAMLRVTDCVGDSVSIAIPQTTEWQRIGD